jgi:hypothetical protein
MLNINDWIQMKDDGKRGDAPTWIPALVVNVHKSRGGTLGHSTDKSIFAVTKFHPGVVSSEPFNHYFDKDEGEKWRQVPEKAPAEAKPTEEDDQ